MYNKSLVWIRRDMRLEDNRALSEASKSSKEITLVFVFDTSILSKLPEEDKRVTFLVESLLDIQTQLKDKKSNIIILKGDPKKIIPKLSKGFDAVFTNKDYEPYAKERDALISSKIKNFHSFKDHVIFEEDEIVKDDNTIYKVFTPYKRKWIEALEDKDHQNFNHKNNFSSIDVTYTREGLFKLIGFKDQENNLIKGGSTSAKNLFKQFLNHIDKYDKDRDYPSIEGTSNLSTHLRFGTISTRYLIREIINKDSNGVAIWLSELIWRDFYQMILHHHPEVSTNSFKKHWDSFYWENNIELFEKWKNGDTGFPLVDAAMRCLNETGMMHNRLRMLTANFLTKILLIDWRWGERYFAEKLLDYDMAANNGGWQWSAGTGCDAQPYFRIFNPTTQIDKFDKDHEFINQWVKEDISPIVDYKERRKLALDRMKEFNAKQD